MSFCFVSETVASSSKLAASSLVWCRIDLYDEEVINSFDSISDFAVGECDAIFGTDLSSPVQLVESVRWI